MFFEQVVASDSNLDKIVADFIKVEDQNFALFNYVTEMNNQVEGLQESITKLRSDIKEAKVRYFVALTYRFPSIFAVDAFFKFWSRNYEYRDHYNAEYEGYGF